MTKPGGFTLIEILIVVFILALLALISIPVFYLFSRNADVDNAAQEFYTTLNLAQSKTVSSENESQYGVYLDTSVSPNQYILFKGASYETRETAADQNFWLPKTVEFSDVTLDGGNEVVFSRLTGYATPAGSVAVSLKTDASKLKNVFISSSGIISFTEPLAISDTRVKDSRHLHFDYGRTIDTNTESITLLFDGSVSEVIPITTNMSGGQIDWTGTVSVGGADQTVRVHTHSLNSPDTQFSLYRDGRVNDKTLTVTLSGDASGNVAQYSADGLTTSFSSLYVSNFVWQ